MSGEVRYPTLPKDDQTQMPPLIQKQGHGSMKERHGKAVVK